MKTTVGALMIALGAPLLWSGVVSAEDVPRFGIFEKSFTHSGSYSNPYAQAGATASFKGPDGNTRTIPLFWDGGTTWKVRFSPSLAGTWTWSTSSADPGLDGKSGSFSCVASTNRGGLRARSSYPYHFECEDGTPFWWMGDTMWRAGQKDPAENLDRTTFFHYVDVRAGQGFNHIHSNMGASNASNEGGSIWDGTPGQKVRPSYFQEIDTRVRYMNAKGITVGYMLAWAQDWDDYGETERLRYARYVVARYSAFNVVFIVSGEYNETLTADAYRKIGQEIDRTDPHKRMTAIHSTGSVEVFAGESWMDFGDYKQTYSSLHGSILEARDHNKPVVNAEYAYFLRDQDGDGIVDKPNSATLEEIRNATWDIVMAGGYFVTGWGTTYLGGRRDPGPFDVDAPKNDPWEDDVQHVRKAFTGLEWWKLQPSDGLLSGSGTRYCLAETGRQYLAYVRGNGGTNSLSLGGAASATYTVQRFDPRNGTYTALADYTGTGPVTLDPPDSQDWVFVLKVKSAPANQPPTVSLSADKTTVRPDEVVTFSVTASDPDGSLASHVWNWGNATENGTGAPPSTKTHGWSATGTYSVTLKVTDNGGLSATSNAVSIRVAANQPPAITSASASPSQGPAPLTVSFNVSATDPEGDPLTYAWDFQGDGVYDATGKSATYTYSAAGHYDPVVRVSDGTSSVTQQLTVDVEAGGGTTTVDLPAEADTYVYQNNPDTNYGSATSFTVGGGTDLRVAWIRFNVTGLPPDASITDARLVLVCTNASSEGGGTIRKFAPSNEAWDERQPTWNSPLAGGDATGDLASLGPVASGSTYELGNLAGAVPLSGRVTFVLRSPFQDGAGYASKEHGTTSQRPRLRITYTTVSPAFSVAIEYVSTGRPYSLATAKAGALYYIDRSYTISSLTAGLDGQVLIRTANDDKKVAAAEHLRFTVSQPAVVYVGYDRRATGLPSWLADGTWTLVEEALAVTDAPASPLKVYARTVEAGAVTLGGNLAGGGTGAQSNYVVVVKPGGMGKTLEAVAWPEGPIPADTWVHGGDGDGDGLQDGFETARGLDPREVDTDGDGEPDETEILPDGRTFWEAQQEELAVSEGDGDGRSRCGALGLEALVLAGLAALGRRLLRLF